MARKKLSEFTAKTLLFRSLGLPYEGVAIALQGQELPNIDLRNDGLYVVKVDQGVKGRMKKGLVKLKVPGEKVEEAVKELANKGYSQFLIEEFLPHDSSLERYFSMERTRDGIIVYYSSIGGIDIEQNQDKVKRIVIASEAWQSSDGIASSPSAPRNDSIKEISETLGLPFNVFRNILQFFNDQYISFLEVNPLVVEKNTFHFLDLAVEVDSAAEFFVQNSWKASDFVEGSAVEKTEEEKNILGLQATSLASLKMEILNPNGSIFVMLFGGGGSIVVADEIFNLGKSNELANYSDYSGGPREDETVIYVENLLQALLKSNAKKKVFIIAGTYANFTDVSVTFRGVIKAMEKVKVQLQKQNIQVFVRRPGPNQKIGLPMIRDYLEKEHMCGGVWDSSMVLSDIVIKAIDYLEK